jgi:hypothetical protein
MRAILRNKRRDLYYAGRERWVPDPSQALDFDEIEHVGRLAFEGGFTELEVVVTDENSNCVLALPVRLASPMMREWHGEQLACVAA